LLICVPLSGCGKSAEVGNPPVETPPAPAVAVPASVTAAPQQSVGDTYAYTCESGKRIVATYFVDEDRAVISYHDKTVQMNIAISASGARYLGEGWVWWTRGTTEASLFRATESGDTGEMLESCTGSGEPIDNPNQES
jgi:membrane-bound inhibitor of C-type lysozyme